MDFKAQANTDSGKMLIIPTSLLYLSLAKLVTREHRTDSGTR